MGHNSNHNASTSRGGLMDSWLYNIRARSRSHRLCDDYDDSRSSPWKRLRDRVEAANNEHKTEEETT